MTSTFPMKVWSFTFWKKSSLEWTTCEFQRGVCEGDAHACRSSLDFDKQFQYR